MRIYTLLPLLLVFAIATIFPLTAQQEDWTRVALPVPTASQEKPLPAIFEVIQPHFNNEMVSDALLLRLKKENLQALSKRIEAEDGRMIFEIPYTEGKVITFQLQKNELLTEDFSVKTSAGDYPYKPGHYLKGMVKALPNSLAAISIFDNMIMGVFATREGNYVIGPLKTANGISSDEYILYKESDLKISNDFSCYADEEPAPGAKKQSNQGQEKSLATAIVKVYFECDYKLYQEQGSNSTNAANFVTGAFNVVSTLYSNESINTQISQIFVWTSQDPYRSTSSSDALTDFRTRLNTNGFNGDIAHLLSRTTGNLGGIAYLDVLCNRSYSYAYSNIGSTYSTFPTYSWTVEVMTHEMGHNLGSPHTQSCNWTGGPIDNCYCVEGTCSPGPEPPATGGTIMSYCHLNGNTSSCTLPSGSNPGINFSAGFGTQPGNLIRNRVDNAACLTGASPRSNLTAATGSMSATGTTINATISVTNNGAAAASASTVGYYLSPDASLSSGDYLFTTRTAPALANGATSSNIVVNMDLSTVTGIPGGTYYVMFFIDKDNVVGESNESDNIFYWNTPQITLVGSCSAPTAAQISASNITNNSARLNCSVTGVTQYDWQYRVVGTTTWTAVTEGTSNFFNATGLTASTNYEFQARVQCGTTWSNWSPSVNFTTTAATCNAPTTAQISATNITNNSVRLNCSVTGVTQYDWQYRVVGTTNWTAVTEGTSNFFNASGLTASTNYEFQARVQCGTTWSNWSPSVNFTTTAATCNAPTTAQISATNLTSSTAQLNCSITGVTQYDWQYRGTGTTTWTAVTEGSPNFFNATGLTANAGYEFQVRVQCGTTWSNWSASVNFTTPAICNAPIATQTSTSNITANAAQLNCSVTGVTQYDWQYRLTGTTTWTDLLEGSTNLYNLSGLSASTGYEFQVRTRCGTTNWSAWSPTRTFTTTALACSTPSSAQVSASNITTTTVRFNHSVNGYSSYGWRYRRNGTITWVTLANTTTNFRDVTGLTRNTRYDFQVRVFCNNAWTSWSATKAFTTANTGPLEGGNEPVTNGTLPTTEAIVNDFGLKAYPLPATDYLSLEYRVEEESQLRVALYDLTGRLLKTIPLGIVARGTHTTQVQLENIHSGIYLLEMTGNQTSERIKIVVQ